MMVVFANVEKICCVYDASRKYTIFANPECNANFVAKTSHARRRRPMPAIRPPPPPTEAIDAQPSLQEDTSEIAQEDQDISTEQANQEKAVDEEDMSMSAEVQAPFASTGGDDDDSDSDPDAPLPKIVLDDSDDDE